MIKKYKCQATFVKLHVCVSSVTAASLYDKLQLNLQCSQYDVKFSQFVLENSSREDKHECPFARSSIQLTLILCEILRIGEPRKLTSKLLVP